MNNTHKAMLAIIVLSLLVSFYLYPSAPEKMAIHWNAEGKADGFGNKTIGLFLLPGILLVLYLLFLAIPKIDQLKKNIESFHDSYDMAILGIILFLAYIFALSIIYNFGRQFNMTVMLLPAFASLFYIIGEMLHFSKRNWFIGIRTPWTLSNDVVWDKTHKLGAMLFKVCAGLSLFGIVLQNHAILFVIGPVLLCSLYLIFYSYIEFKKQQSTG
jgi:uncharacterized membrane protein